MAKSLLLRREISKLWKYADGLRTLLPSDRPVEVKRVRRTRAWGAADCTQEDGRYLIRIRTDLTYMETIDALCHEWAHALHWSDETDHPDEWGIEYARVYRAMLSISADWSDMS